MRSRSGWYRLLLLIVVPILLHQAPSSVPLKSPARVHSLAPTVGALVPPLDSILPQSSFNNLAQETLSALPLRSDLDPKSDFHQVPAQVMRGAEAVGHVAEWLEKNPKDHEAGKEFYRVCAEKEGVLTAIRAMCVKRFWDMGGEKSAQFSENLVWIAKQLPSSK